MNILLWGVGLFAVFFTVHVIVWRRRSPRSHTQALLQIAFLTWAAGSFTIVLLALQPGAWSRAALGDAVSYAHVFLLFFSLVLAYVATYSAVEVDSPSLVMTLSIARAGQAGLAEGEFYKQMNDDVLVLPRLRDLLRDGLAIKRDDRYVITPSGKKLVSLFVFYRRLLGATKGG